MILVVEEDNGEQWEDYQKWVARLYEIKTEKTAIELEVEWKDYIVVLMNVANISVNPTYLNIMEYSKVKRKKLHKKILKDNSFYIWLEKTYKAKEIKFEITHNYRIC